MTIKTVRWTPTLTDKPAKTVRQALVYTREMFLEEGRWLQGEWFQNHNPNLNPQDPFCNSWGACLQGGISAVTLGLASSEQLCQIAPVRFDHIETEETPWVMFEDEYVPTRHQLVPKSRIDLFVRTKEAVLTALEEVHEASYYGNIPEFNDLDETTRDDIIELLDHAIAKQPKPRVRKAGLTGAASAD